MLALKQAAVLVISMALILSVGARSTSATDNPPPDLERHIEMLNLPINSAMRNGAQSPVMSAGTNATLALPSWSRIVWTSYRDAGVMTPGNWELYKSSADGTNPIRLTDNDNEDTEPDLNRGATRITFVSKRDGDYEIFVMNADGSGQTQLTANNSSDLYPRWSPDGTKIAFYSNRNGNNEIYVMNADGTNQIRLTNNSSAHDITPTWSPDGTMIMFGSNRRSDGKWALWVMYANGTNQIQFSNPSYFAGYPSWSPDGSKIAFNDDDNHDGWYDLAIININGLGKYYPGGESTSYREFFEPYWDPTGQYYAYTAVEWTYVVNQGYYWFRGWIECMDTSINQHFNIIINAVDWYVSWATVDVNAPLVRVNSLARYSATTSFNVPWTGADVGEAGLRRIDIQGRDGVNGTWLLVNQLDPTSSSSNVIGADGHTYYIRARGIDNAWNTQPYTSNVNGEAVITVDTSGPQSLHLSAPPLTNSRQVAVTWGAQDAQSGISSYSISVTLDADAPISWLLNTSSNNGVYTVPADKTKACFTLVARNGAGSPATIDSVCTIVDDVAPTTIVTITQPISVPWFVVQWQGVDAISAIASYDAQVREGAGAWTPWLTSTQVTTEGFRGELGTSYTFRVRATDSMGNIEPYSGEEVSVTTPLLAVAGTVVDNHGQPVALARVDTLPAALGSAMTGVSGNYDFYLNVTGTYTVAVTHSRYGELPSLNGFPIQNSITLPEIVLPPANNIIHNGHFEAGTFTNWISGGEALPIITTTVHSGEYAALLGATSLPISRRNGTSAPATNWIEQSIEILGSSPTSPTLSLVYKPLSVHAGNTLYAIVGTANNTLTYTIPVETTDWQHYWAALPNITVPTMTLRLQWEQNDPNGGVLVDEVTLGTTIPAMNALYLPMVLHIP